MTRQFIIGLIIIAIILQSIAGYLDMNSKNNIGPISKTHLWNDARFILIIAGLLLALKK
jgi:hypothetical protein